MTKGDSQVMSRRVEIGATFVLWRTEYRTSAYTDQFDRRHGGYVVVDEDTVTVTEVLEVPGMWEPREKYYGLRASGESGRKYSLNAHRYPDDSPTPTYYWDPVEGGDGVVFRPVDAVQAYNLRADVHVDEEGKGIQPAGTEKCEKHK